MICTTPFPHSGHPLGRSSSGPDYVLRRKCFSGMMQPVVMIWLWAEYPIHFDRWVESFDG